MNFIDQLSKQLSILRGHVDNTEVAYINAPVDDLSGFAKTVMNGNGLTGDIQEADRFHITLAIFPNFPDTAIGEFLKLSLPIRFNITAIKLGTFPKAPSNPLIMHVDPDPALVRLQSDIYNLGIKLGLQLPDFDYFKASLWQPHVTLAMDVENMPEKFAPINPVKLNVDRFVVQREGYDQVIEINLPGSIKDRPFITVRSAVQKIVQKPKPIERIAPKTLEVSEEEFMAMLRGEVVVHGPSRRVLTFEDGPFAIRHGKHIDQEGEEGQKGGSQPGFTHAEGSVGSGAGVAPSGSREVRFAGSDEAMAKLNAKEFDIGRDPDLSKMQDSNGRASVKDLPDDEPSRVEDVEHGLTDEELWELLNWQADNSRSMTVGKLKEDVDRYADSPDEFFGLRVYTGGTLAEGTPENIAALMEGLDEQGILSVEFGYDAMKELYEVRKDTADVRERLTQEATSGPKTFEDFLGIVQEVGKKPEVGGLANDEIREYFSKLQEISLEGAIADIERMDNMLVMTPNEFEGPFRSDIVPNEEDSPEYKALVEQYGSDTVEDVASMVWAIQSDRAKYFKFNLRRAVTMGEIDPDDLGFLDARTHGSKPWVDLPEVLYHATTASDAIEANGFKSRYELSMFGGVGLGGGDDETISFTEDREIAEGIEFFLQEAQSVAAGDFTLQQMMVKAESGEGADKPFLREFLTRTHAGGPRTSDEILDSDWSPSGAPETWPEPIKQWHDAITKNSTSGLTDERVWDYYRFSYVRTRQAAGGLVDPMFFSTDYEGLANLDPNQFTVIEVRKNPGTKGFQMGALGEWRIVGGEAVDIQEIHDTVALEERAEVGDVVALGVLPLSLPISVVSDKGWEEIGERSEATDEELGIETEVEEAVPDLVTPEEDEELPLVADTPQGRQAAGLKVPVGLDEPEIEEDEAIERGRPKPPKPKTIYADKKKEYPDYFKGQERLGAAAFGTQVFTPFLEGHINNFEGSRQNAAREAFNRVVGAQKENNSDVHGFALSNNGQIVGIGSLNFKPENSPADGDFIDIETLVTTEPGNTQAAMEKLINQAASEKRGISMNAANGAKDFLSSIGMRQDGKGTFFLNPEDIEGLANELKGPKSGQFIAPSSKPKIRQRFGRLFEEAEITTPIDNRPPPIPRDRQNFESRDKWERFNWDAFQDPEMVWNPDAQMAGVFEENENALFQDEIDEDAERGKSEILGKIKEGGNNSVAFGRLGQSVSELFGGKPRDMKNFVKSDKDYERDYGLDVVWPDGKIEDEEGANERLSDFAHQAEGVRDEDSLGSWPDSTEYIYNRTQAALKESGFETSDKVRLFRGIKSGSLPEDHDGGYVKLNLGAISSWTFNRSTAAHTATQGGRGTLLRVDVPISRIFSMWATGPGSREAMEYLILGQDGIRAWATKISRK